jgi:hypothetical protein
MQQYCPSPYGFKRAMVDLPSFIRNEIEKMTASDFQILYRRPISVVTGFQVGVQCSAVFNHLHI